jgi:hypothetical protein
MLALIHKNTMRIISKKRDYYDSVMAHGQDQTVVFVRNAEELDLKNIPKEVNGKLWSYDFIGTHSNSEVSIQFSPNTIVFCGKTYRSVTCICTTKTVPPKKEVKVFYNYDDIVEYAKTYGIEVKHKTWYWNPTDPASFFNPTGTKVLEEFCIKNRYSILTYADMKQMEEYGYSAEHKLIANGYLDKMQFFRVMDSFAAYQELDMFISGVLPQSSAMPIQIADKDRITQRGFDKYSFRKTPSKGK